MVEIEIGVLSQQCLDRRIPERETLQREVAHWKRQRNAEGPGSSGCSMSDAPARNWDVFIHRLCSASSLKPSESVKATVQSY